MRTVHTIKSEDFTSDVVQRLTAILAQRASQTPFHLFLAGGSTPKAVYAGLAESTVDWTNIHLWWGDERFVPPDHPDSNFAMVKSQLLDKIKIAPIQVHSWPILSTPELSAETYELEFRTFFARDQQALNLQLLGLGDDGHTASLFPNSKALSETAKFCCANVVQGKESARLTLTYPALLSSRRVVFLVKGADKATALKEVLEDNLHPASRVFGLDSTEFWVDTLAASQLSL